MKKILFTLVFTLFYLPLCGFSQSDIHTPNKSEPAAFKLAKVYFLPDWSESGMKFDGTDEKPCTEVCPQKTSYDCASGQTETYTNSCGLTCSRCVKCYGCEAKGYTLGGCPENASCLNDCCNKLYKLVSCDSGYVLDGSSCRTETCSDNPNICSGGKSCVSGICQCPSGQTDVGGKCETSTCTNNGIKCSGSTGVCNTSTGKCVECLANSDCGGGKECNANNQCIVPDACAKITCSGGKSCVDGACVCPSGQVDNNGTCETPNCYSEDCPSGEVCLNSVCVADRDCKTGDLFYADGVCTDVYDSKKTIIAVVVDPERRMLVHIGKRPLLLATSASDYFYQDLPFIANEISTVSERGIYYTKALRKSAPGSGKDWCANLQYDSIMEHFYAPGSGEILNLIRNLPEVRKGFETLHNNGAISDILLLNKDEYLVSSDEAADNPHKMLAYLLDENKIWQSGYQTQVFKTDTSTFMRCFARYKCKSDDATKCEIVPSYVSLNPKVIYVDTSNQSLGTPPCGYQEDTFPWNEKYKRFAMFTQPTDCGGSSGGDTETPETPKTPCQTNDDIYCNGTTCFCKTSSTDLYGADKNYKGATLMGRVGNQGLVILGPIGSATTGSDAERQCSSYSRGNFSNWRIPNPSDVQNWSGSGIIYNLGLPYAKSGSIYYRWTGYGWNYNDQSSGSQSLYCTHSYSNIYRE